MMRSPGDESLPGLKRVQYETRSRYRKNVGNDCLEEIHLHSVKIKDLGSCLVPHSTNTTPLGVQNSDDLQNIQKSVPFMCKKRDVNLQNIRRSPRLSVQSTRDKNVCESDREGLKCRSNSQIESLDKKKLCFPEEVILDKSPRIDYQNRSVEYEGKTNLKNVRKSPRFSEEARERDMQLLFESNEKITNSRKKSQIKDLNQEKFISPAEVKFASMTQVYNESSNVEGERNVQNTRKLPRVSGNVLVEGLQNIVDSNDKGVCTYESHITSTCKSNLSLKTKATPTSIPHIPNTGASYDRIMNSQSIRKPIRLSGKNGEMDSQKKNLPAEFSFAADVELTTVTEVQNKSSDCNQGTDLKTMQKSLRLSCRIRETNLDNNIECSKEMRTKPQEDSSYLNNLSVVKLFDKPQVQNVSANSYGHVDLINMQKSPHLSGIKRQQDLQICSRKKVKLGAESQKKGCRGNNLPLPSKVKLTNAPSAQNQTVKSREEINLGAKSQKKGFDGSTMSPPIEVDLTSAPSLHSEITKADGCLLNKAVGSPLNSSKSLPSFQYYVSSGKGINLVVDLNSSLSDWTKKIFSSSSQSLQKNKFESFRQEIESLRSKKMISSLLSTSNPFNKIIPSHLQSDACLQSVSGETCLLRSYVPERDNGSSDITEINSCIEVRSRDGHLENSNDFNSETSGDNISSSQEYLETRITICETEASEQSSKRPVNTAPDGSHKRKGLGRKICGIRLKSGKQLGSRKSMRLWYQGGHR